MDISPAQNGTSSATHETKQISICFSASNPQQKKEWKRKPRTWQQVLLHVRLDTMKFKRMRSCTAPSSAYTSSSLCAIKIGGVADDFRTDRVGKDDGFLCE